MRDRVSKCPPRCTAMHSASVLAVTVRAFRQCKMALEGVSVKLLQAVECSVLVEIP